ncbi:MAG: hypothetical protein ABR985_21540 [Methanotrichaceae archaeon]|jgi:hypothetical protein
MTLNLSEQRTFSPTDGLDIHGNSSVSEVYFAAITHGAVLEEEVMPVVGCQFHHKFDPKRVKEMLHWKVQAGGIIETKAGSAQLPKL